MWTSNLPRDTVPPMEAALRNSNELICKHRKLHVRLQVPGKDSSESGPSLINWVHTGRKNLILPQIAIIQYHCCFLHTCTILMKITQIIYYG